MEALKTLVGMLIVSIISYSSYGEEVQQPVKASDVGEMIRDYNKLVAELKKETVAYRSSSTIFADYAKVCLMYIIPWAEEGEESRRKVRDSRHSLGEEQFVKEFKYDEELANSEIGKVVSSLLVGLYAKALEDSLRSDKNMAKLSPEMAKSFVSLSAFVLRTVGPSPVDPHKFKNPYEKESLAYHEFKRNLGHATCMAQGAIATFVAKLPGELAEKKRQADELYGRILELAHNVEDVPPKYVDSYSSLLETRDPEEVKRVLKAFLSATDKQLLDMVEKKRMLNKDKNR